MKTFYLLILLFVGLNLYSQDDDYCPCEEDENTFDFLNSMVSSTDDMIYLPEDDNQFFEVESDFETEDLYVPGEELSPVANVVDVSNFERSGPSGLYPVRSYREVMKRKVKRKARKRRRSARMKSYKGGCPFF